MNIQKLIYSLFFIIALHLTGCADAGQDKIVQSSSIVILEANASTASVGGEIITYTWEQVRGKKVKIDHDTNKNITFVAPNVEIESTLIFMLTTIEEGGDPDTFVSFDCVKVTVQPSKTEDTIAPVITMNGENNVTLYIGEQYLEVGATAVDNVDGTVEVKITGTVNTNIPGTYIITYTATDNADNNASIERTVNIITQDEGNETNDTVGQGDYTDINLTADWSVPKNALFLDIRADWERIESRPVGAIGGALYEYGNPDFVQNILTLVHQNKKKQIILICHSGSRSTEAAKLLSTEGFSNISQIVGGMISWKAVKPDEILTGPLNKEL